LDTTNVGWYAFRTNASKMILPKLELSDEDQSHEPLSSPDWNPRRAVRIKASLVGVESGTDLGSIYNMPPLQYLFFYFFYFLF
jgi:hypothetical protein